MRLIQPYVAHCSVPCVRLPIVLTFAAQVKRLELDSNDSVGRTMKLKENDNNKSRV